MKRTCISLGGNMMLSLSLLEIKDICGNRMYSLQGQCLHCGVLFVFSLAPPTRWRSHFPMSLSLYGAGLEFAIERNFSETWKVWTWKLGRSWWFTDISRIFCLVVLELSWPPLDRIFPRLWPRRWFLDFSTRSTTWVVSISWFLRIYRFLLRDAPATIIHTFPAAFSHMCLPLYSIHFHHNAFYFLPSSD